MRAYSRQLGLRLIVCISTISLPACFFAGCKGAYSQNSAGSSTISLPILEYFKTGPVQDTAESDHGQGALIFPVLDVFSPEGLLVYHTVDLADARIFLDKFVQNTQGLTPQPGSESWSSIRNRFPGLMALNKVSPAYTFLIIKLEGCEACDLQAAMLKQYEERLSQTSVKRQIIMLNR